MGDPEIFLDMMDVQQEVLAAHNIPQAVQSSAGAFLSPALTLNHSLSTDLVADPALSTAALDCLTTTKAPGTVKSYSTVVLRFQAFSLLASHPFPHLTTEAVTQFFLHAVRHTGYAFLSCIKPALVYLEVAMGKASSFTPTVNLLLKGAKQPARNHRGPAKKAPALSPLQLASVSAKIYPPDDHVGLACPVCLRTAFLCSFHISHAVPLILFCQASSKAFRAR